MLYLIFLFLIWAIALFHVWEHRRYIEELRALQRTLAAFTPDRLKLPSQLRDRDWRIVSLDATKLSLRRAFVIKDQFSAARYAAPVLFFVLSVLVLNMWIMAGVYFAGIIVKWFLTRTVLDLSPNNPRYDVKLFSWTLFGEALPEEAPERTLFGTLKKKK